MGMTPRSTLKVKVIGQSSRSPGQNSSFQESFYSFTGNGSRVKGDPGQGQRSLSLKCVESTCNSPYDVIKRQVVSHQRQVAFLIPVTLKTTIRYYALNWILPHISGLNVNSILMFVTFREFISLAAFKMGFLER